MTLNQRVDQLTKMVRVLTPDDQMAAEANYQRYLETWGALLATMDPDHAGILFRAVEAHGCVTANGALLVDRAGGRLAEIASRMVSDSVSWHFQGPLALPSEVVRVYFEDPDATPHHDCDRCGFMVPVHTGWRKGYVVVDPPRHYFDTCPLCGGRCGYSAYFMTMKGTIERCTTCDELRPQTPAQAKHVNHHRRPVCQYMTCVSKVSVSPRAFVADF
jgi:hypothetical protein